MTHPGGGSGGTGPGGPGGTGPGRDGVESLRPRPGRPVTRLGAVAYLAQTAALAVALGLLIAPAPAPERTVHSRPATAEEVQRHTEARLRWAIDHQ